MMTHFLVNSPYLILELSVTLDMYWYSTVSFFLIFLCLIMHNFITLPKNLSMYYLS